MISNSQYVLIIDAISQFVIYLQVHFFFSKCDMIKCKAASLRLLMYISII